MPRPRWKPGDHWMVCDRCGFQRRYSQMRKEWTNLWVCADTCYEPRHPQLDVRARPERMRVPVARPYTTAVEVGTVTADDL